MSHMGDKATDAFEKTKKCCKKSCRHKLGW